MPTEAGKYATIVSQLVKHATPNKPDSQRILILKLRASLLRLPVILGRYDNIPYEQRVCTSCKSGHIGDEFHFIFGMSDTAGT